MTDSIATRIAELGLELPMPAAPIASYQPAVLIGGLLHISGQLPFRDGEIVTGRLGDDMNDAHGADAARRCGLMLIAQMAQALGSLDRVARIVKLGVYVNCAPDYHAQPQVANGASDLMEAVFGEAGRHARSAVGVAALPRGAAVEIDAIVAVRD